MGNKVNNPRDTQDKRVDQPDFNRFDRTRRREGGDDSLAEASPTDPKNDEKVIVNEQRERKTVNTPSQTAANTSEGISSNEETIDNS